MYIVTFFIIFLFVHFAQKNGKISLNILFDKNHNKVYNRGNKKGEDSMLGPNISIQKNVAENIDKKVSELMGAVKVHPSMKKYSPHIRKSVQEEIHAILQNRIKDYSLDIGIDDLNKWLDTYTPYAQASTTAYIKRIAKAKGLGNLSTEQVDYVKSALKNSVTETDWFDWSNPGKAVVIPKHGKALGTERNMAAKVETQVDWAVNKTVENALKPENVIAFLVKNKKYLPANILENEDTVSVVDDIISLAEGYLYNSKNTKITPRSVRNINTELLHAALSANTDISNFSGALLRKLGTDIFVNNDEKLGKIRKHLVDKLSEKTEKEDKEYKTMMEVRALMERFFKAVRWSMHYKTGAFDSSSYTAENHYQQIELAILEFVANTNLSMKTIKERFEKIFMSNDNPEAVERLYMTEVLNAWWFNVSRTLGLDTDIALEIQADIVSEEVGAYESYNAEHFMRDTVKEDDIRSTFKKIIDSNSPLAKAVLDEFYKEQDEIEKYVERYTTQKRMADKIRAAKRDETKELKETLNSINRKHGFMGKDKIEMPKKKSKDKATSKSDNSKKFKDLKKVFDATLGEREVDDMYAFKYLKDKDFIKLRNALFGNQPIKSAADLNKFLKGAYVIAGAETELQKYKFFVSHQSIMRGIISDNWNDITTADLAKEEERISNRNKKIVDRINKRKVKPLIADKDKDDYVKWASDQEDKFRKAQEVDKKRHEKIVNIVNKRNDMLNNFFDTKFSDKKITELEERSKKYKEQLDKKSVRVANAAMKAVVGLKVKLKKEIGSALKYSAKVDLDTESFDEALSKFQSNFVSGVASEVDKELHNMRNNLSNPVSVTEGNKIRGSAVKAAYDAITKNVTDTINESNKVIDAWKEKNIEAVKAADSAARSAISNKASNLLDTAEKQFKTVVDKEIANINASDLPAYQKDIAINQLKAKALNSLKDYKDAVSAKEKKRIADMNHEAVLTNEVNKARRELTKTYMSWKSDFKKAAKGDVVKVFDANVTYRTRQKQTNDDVEYVDDDDVEWL